MSLTHCTKCGHLMSTTAPRCPGCGMPPYRRGLVASPAIPHRHNSHLTALGANHYIVIALVAVTMIALVAWWAFYIRESARNAGASGAAEPGHAPHVVVEPHSNVEIAREYWCEKAAQGFATVVGVTEILARITAVDCAGNTDPRGCATGVSRADAEELIRQAGWDYEQHVYSCRDTPGPDAATLKLDAFVRCDSRAMEESTPPPPGTLFVSPPRPENIIDLGEGRYEVHSDVGFEEWPRVPGRPQTNLHRNYVCTVKFLGNSKWQVEGFHFLD